jgi:hypothetical protein
MRKYRSTTRPNITGEAEGRRAWELQAKLEALLLSHVQDVRALYQDRGALQKATSRTADADANADKNERNQHACEQVVKYETELAGVRAEVEAKKPELEAVRSWLMDAENGWTKSRAEAETLCAQTTAGVVNMDEERITLRLMEHMKSMEAEMASLRLSEKALKWMKCRNEGCSISDCDLTRYLTN